MRRADALAMDAADPLAFARERFDLPKGVVYLDGNSLGACPRSTPARVAGAVLHEWAHGLIGSWNSAGWIDAPARVGAAIAPLVGADPDEVIAADSTSVNLFKLAAAALALRPDRSLVLCDADEFPTDLYMLQGLSALMGREIEVRPLPLGRLGPAVDRGDAALLLLSHVNYRRAEVRDLPRWASRSDDAGVLTLFDLSHSAGALPVDLNGAGADFAVGCGYKYLNGGPGAPAWLFVARRWHEEAHSPLSGWMGHAAPFEFQPGYVPAAGMRRWLCGTPPVLALAALEEGVRAFEGVDMALVEAKSHALSELFLARVEARMPGVFLIDPPPVERRGSHVILGHAQAYALVRAFIEAGVVGDFRAPNLLRFGFTPLYLRFVDVWDAVERMAQVHGEGAWREARFAELAAVT